MIEKPLIEVLVDAVTPFAAFGDVLNEAVGDDETIEVELPIGHFRRALEAKTKAESGEGLLYPPLLMVSADGTITPVESIRLGAIEECARLVEALAPDGEARVYNEMAEAIRALKDRFVGDDGKSA